MLKPVVSVIMPVFRNKDTLAKALDSFLAQDIKEPCELIMGIDEGGDGTMDLAKQYASNHPSIKIHTEATRMGQALSRYKAILDSQGDFIYFMDADDRLRPDCLSIFLNTIRKTGADCVNASFYVVDSEKKQFRFPFVRKQNLNKHQAMSAFFMDASFRGFLWTKMWRREIIEKRPLLLLTSTKDMFEDVAFCLSLLSHCEKVATIRTPLYYYYKNVPTSAMSVTRCDRASRHLSVFALARRFLETVGDDGLVKAFKTHRFRCWLSLAFDLMLDKKNGASKDYERAVKKEWAEIKNMKKALPLEGRAYSELLTRAWLR